MLHKLSFPHPRHPKLTWFALRQSKILESHLVKEELYKNSDAFNAQTHECAFQNLWKYVESLNEIEQLAERFDICCDNVSDGEALQTLTPTQK